MDFDSKNFMGIFTNQDSSIMLKVKINRKNELIFYSLYKAVVMIINRMASFGSGEEGSFH